MDIAQYLSGLLKLPCPTLQRLCVSLISQILSTHQANVEDRMNERVDESSFYSKYYMNPRKVKVHVSNQLLFNQGNVFPQIEAILQNLYLFISSLDKLEPASLVALDRIFKVLGEAVTNYTEPLINMFKEIFKRINNGFTFEGIKSIFETIGTLIIKVNTNHASHKLIIDQLIPELNLLMNKGINEISSFLFQIYALCIRHLPSFPADIRVAVCD